LIPASHGSAFEIDSIEKELESLWSEFEFFVVGIVAGRPGEGSFFETLGCDPETGAIDVRGARWRFRSGH